MISMLNQHDSIAAQHPAPHAKRNGDEHGCLKQATALKGRGAEKCKHSRYQHADYGAEAICELSKKIHCA